MTIAEHHPLRAAPRGVGSTRPDVVLRPAPFDRPMRLGEFIDALDVLDPSLPIAFDDGRVPFFFCSWRGRHTDLSLDAEHETSINDRGGYALSTVTMLHRAAVHADGWAFPGWKGDEFRMDRDSQLWADPEGECRMRAPVSVYAQGERAIIVIRQFEDYE